MTSIVQAIFIWVTGIIRFIFRQPVTSHKHFAKEVQPSKGNESGILRSTIDPDHLLETWYDDVTTLYDLMNFSVKKFADRNCIGWRELVKEHREEKEVTKTVRGKEIKEKRTWTLYEMSAFKWISYKQFGERVQNVASGLVSDKVGLPRKSKNFAIFCNTCPEWVMMLHACSSQSVTISTVYANLGEEGLQHALNEGKITHLFLSSDLLQALANVVDNCPSLKVIIYKDKPQEKIVETIKSKNIKFFSFDEIEQLGKQNPVPATPPKKDDVMMHMYTSGTTGAPKGVVILHKNLIAVIASGFKIVDVDPSDVYVGYLPLAHVLELVVENAILLAGASIGYGNARTLTAANMKNSYGDIKELRPTLMAGVPEVWERIRKGSMDKLAKRPVAKAIFQFILKTKIHLYKYFGLNIPGLDLIFTPFRKEIGGRLRLMLSGGAPIAADTQTFLRMCFSVNAIQGYGLTETCGVITLQMPNDLEPGVVGPPIPSVETKIVDLPDMNYLHTDKPNPRGELLVRGINVTAGYFQNEEETKKVYLDDGWFATGDVAELLPSGAYKIIDRKKNLVKLAGGEYIALERLESVLKHNDFVENICVYGDSSKHYPVAIVMPNKANLEKWADKNGIHEHDHKALCQNEQVTEAVTNSLKETGKKNRLASFEIPQAVFIAPDEWTAENDMLTAAFKIKRRNIVQKYKKEVDEMYS